MPQGIQVMDGGGTPILDLGMSVGRFLGAVQAFSADGSISHGEFVTGTPFFTCLILSTWIAGSKLPAVSFSGTTMSWTYSGATAKNDVLILYGVF